MIKKYNITELKNLKIDITKPSIIFLYGDLWAWKTTLSKHIINKILWYRWNVISPTYTYYNKIELRTDNWELGNIYHFDLYRLRDYNEFFSIWWEEILDNNTWIILIEWPEILEKYYKPDIIIKLKKTKNEDEREIEILYLPF